MSFSLKIAPKDKATGRFKSRVNRGLVKAVLEAKAKKGVTQTHICQEMGVDKSTLSRILNGKGNLTLKTIGDISWVLGLRPEIQFVEVEKAMHAGANSPAMLVENHVVQPEQKRTTSSNNFNRVISNQSTIVNTGTSRHERVNVGT